MPPQAAPEGPGAGPERAPERRLRVLVSAFACKPGGVSEDAVGWNIVQALGRHHDLWVVTNAKDEAGIRSAVKSDDGFRAAFTFVSTTPIGRLGSLGFNADYYLWQLRAGLAVRRLAQEVRFDVAHHLTYARYWAPSFLAWLDVPYIFGPVGGGESIPNGFHTILDRRARRLEAVRDLARGVGELDPWVRRTVRGSRIALATTPETGARLRRLKATDVRIMSPLGLDDTDLHRLARASSSSTPFRALSVGRMLPWKGFDLSIRAFAQAALPAAELWMVGDGPHLPALRALAQELHVADRVTFFGRLDRTETLDRIASSHVLVHPSLHEAAGFVCLEAMAAGLPVVSLDAGGPGRLVAAGGGVGVTTTSPGAATEQIADALVTYATDSEAYRTASRDAREHARSCTWARRADAFDELYGEIVGATG